jgi:hypothetical protein
MKGRLDSDVDITFQKGTGVPKVFLIEEKI